MTGSKETFLTQAAPPEVVGPERIREVEGKIRESESTREKVSGIREEKAGEIAALKTQTPGDITAQIALGRRRLLTRIALGDATDADLKKFDRDAAEKQKSIAKQSVPKEEIATREETVKGLDEEIARLDAQGKALAAERDRLWGVYLRELAETAGAEYCAHAEKAFGSLTRVCNLGGILHRLEQRPNGIGLGAREFAIPSLGTESTELPPEKHSTVGIDTNLFSINSDENLYKHVNSREGDLFEEFEKAGLKWPGPSPPPTMPLELVEPAMRKVPVEEGIPISVARPAEPLRAQDGSIAPTQAVTE